MPKVGGKRVNYSLFYNKRKKLKHTKRPMMTIFQEISPKV
jgi:hypothetical protein